MTYQPGPEVNRLASLREVVAWAIGAYAPLTGPGSLAEVGEHVKRTSYRWQDHRGPRSIDYGDCPGHAHAYWFLRMGLMEVADVATVCARVKAHPENCRCGCGRKWAKAFGEGAKARDFFDQESLYRLDALCRGARIPDDVRAWIETVANDPDAKERGRRDRGTRQLPFDPTRVRAAITATRSAREPVAPLNGTAGAVVPAGKLADPVVGPSRPGERVAADGSFVVAREGTQLRVTRVDRIRGETADWSGRVELGELGDGTVLAVAPAGDSDVAFVWADDDGTWYCTARRPGGPTSRLGRYRSERASAAVVLRTRALLALATADGRHECPAFPGLDVVSLVAASSGGRTVVLAVGRDATGSAAAFVELDGRTRARVADNDAVLHRPRGNIRPPTVVTLDERAVALTPEHENAVPFAHWVSHAAANVDHRA